jgi:hypothetical protein
MILGIFTALFAQAPVSVVFTNTNNTTYTLLNQEYPGGAYPLGATGVRWVAQYYLDGGDGVNSPLDPATKLPTGDDVLLTNPNNNQIVTIGTAPTRPWTSGGISFPYSATEINGLVGATIYVRIFNSTTIETATKYIQFNGHYTVGTGAVQSVNILTNVAMSAFGWSAWIPMATDPVIIDADPAIIIAGSGLPEGVIEPPIYAAMVSFNSNTTMDITYPPLTEPELGPGIWTGWIYHSGAWHEADNAPLTGPGRLLFQNVVFTGGKSESPILYDNDVLVTLIPHEDCPIVHSLTCPIDGFDHPESSHYKAEGTGINDLMVPYDPVREECHAFAWIGGVWTPGVLVDPNWVWEDVDFDAEGGVVYVVTYEPWLPVEFSSFAATLTAQNFVKLTWVTETETGVSGYRVLRSEANDVALAITVSPLISATNTSTTQIYNHIDNEVLPETTYYYWLEVVDMDGTTVFHGPTNVYVEANEPPTPSLISTMGNAYPNPFKANSNTNIAYEVKAGETGTITIYNIIGQVVKTIPVSQTNGQVTLKWNGRDSKGNVCASGIYFYKLNTPSLNITKKMVIVN